MAETKPADVLHDRTRLEALRATGLLDSAPDEPFDRLTRLACRLLGVPVALLSLVEADRQFFKSMVGLPQPWALLRETPLSHSFCQHVVARGAPLLLQDARTHPVLGANLAVRDLGVVAYLGMPLTTPEGQVLGALCAIDTEPRSWTPGDAAALRDLAALAMGEIAARRLAAGLEVCLRHAAAEPLQTGATRDLTEVLQAVGSGIHLALGCLDAANAGAVRQVLEALGGSASRSASAGRRLTSLLHPAGLGTGRVDVADLLAGMEEVLADRLSAPGLRLLVDAPPGLPLVRADRGRLEAVLVKLGDHAREAMPWGGTLVLAATTDVVADPGRAGPPVALRPGRYVRLSAVDTGLGVDDARMQAMAPLLGPGAAPGGGDPEGGAFAMTSEPGCGTIATLWLPVAPPIPEA
jgi:signal transduction histidine kinase